MKAQTTKTGSRQFQVEEDTNDEVILMLVGIIGEGLENTNELQEMMYKEVMQQPNTDE